MKSKFYNKRSKSRDGTSYASKGEMKRGAVLKLMQQGGRISELKEQVRIPLIVSGIKLCTYVADFTYVEGGKEIVEDFKGFETAVFKLKWKLAQILYPDKVFRISK